MKRCHLSVWRISRFFVLLFHVVNPAARLRTKDVLTPQQPTPNFMKKTLLLLGLSVAGSVIAGPLEKSPGKAPVNPLPARDPLYLGTITSGVKSSDVYTEGNFSLVVPVYSTLGADTVLAGDVIYVEPYTSWGEGGEVAASLGLGWRHLFGSQPITALTNPNPDAPSPGFLEEGIYLGASFFVDMLDTEADNQFWQLGVGLEVGTRYLELRANYYIPLSDKQLAEETRTREVIRNTSTSNGRRVVGDEPFATENHVAQNVVYQNLQTTTTSTTTIERLFRRYEEGMEGWDAEAALLVPGLDKYFELRLIGGYYSFDNQPFGPQTGGTGNIEGWKAGVEIRPVPAIILTGTWYEDDRLTGSDWTAGVQLQLPFEAGDLGDGKGFWGRMGDAFKPRRRHLAERLAEPVHRQNAAIKLANSVDVETTASTKVKRVTRVVSQTPGQVILADDIIFVNNEGPVGNGIQAGDTQANGADGTAERPFNTVQEGSNAAGGNSTSSGRLWSVYTQATGTSYDENVLVDQGSTRFTSSFIPIVGFSGKTFGGDTDRPVLNGGFYAEVLPTLIVQGYDIRGGYFDGSEVLAGVQARNITNLEVTENRFAEISEMGIEALLTDTGTFNILVRNNQFDETGDSLYLETSGSTVANAELLNNLFTSTNDADDGFDLHALEDSRINALIQGNRFTDDVDYGIHLSSEGAATIDATIQQNLFGGNANNEYIELDATGTSVLIARILNNTFDGESDEDFIDGEVSGNGEFERATMNITLSGNSFAGQDDIDLESVLEFDSLGFSTLTATITNNTFIGNFAPDDGSTAENLITLYGEGEFSQMNLTLSNNTFDGWFEDVLDGNFEGEAGLDLMVSGNRFSGIYNDSTIEVSTDSESSGTLLVNFLNNTLDGFSDGEVLDLEAEGTVNLTANITSNVFSGAFYQVLLAEKINLSVVDVNVTNNTFSGFFGPDAIFITGRGNADGTSMLNANVSNNLFSGGFVDTAIFVRKTGSADVNAIISNNIFTSEIMGTGIAVGSFGQGGEDSGVNATITGNQFRGVTYENAITLYSTDDAKFDAVVTGNTLANGAFTGDLISMYTDESGRIRATVADNVAAAGSEIDLAFFYGESLDDSRLIVEGFDNNRALGILDTFLELEEAGTSNLRVDGTLDATFTNQVLNALDNLSVIGDPAGSFFLNGLQVDLP